MPSVFAHITLPEHDAAYQRATIALRQAEEAIDAASALLAWVARDSQWTSRGIVAMQQEIDVAIHETRIDAHRLDQVRWG